MKRKDIKEGAELYLDKSPDWMTRPSARKVIVLSETPHVERKAYPYTIRVARSDDRNPGVLVRNADSYSHQDPYVTPLGSLRGPYEETLAMVTATIEAERERRRAIHRKANERQTELIELAASVGIQINTKETYTLGSNRGTASHLDVHMTGDEFRKLIAMVKIDE